MITLLFFGRLAELLDCRRLQLAINNPLDVASLRQLLAEKGANWQEFLTTQHALVAVKQAMAQEQASINEGDEVAFFPPVTGG